MSILVDFALVRYSDIEQTHYFYDPRYPTSIQFLLDGQWESWDVGYVGRKAHDPEVRRVAKEAEARVVREHIPGYSQWPTTPRLPEAVPIVVAQSRHSSDEQQHSSPTTHPLQEQAVMSATASDHPSQSTAHPPFPISAPDLWPPSPSSPRPTTQVSSHADTDPYAVEGSLSPITTPLASPYSRKRALSPETDQITYRPLKVNHHEPTLPDARPPDPPDEPNQQEAPPIDPRLMPSGTPPVVVPSRSRETKVLLSLDGDGVRGLSQLLLVESLVHAVCTKIGAHLDPYQVFDLIGGTSLGGVLAIMLSRLRMQIHKAREAYKIIAKEVFPNKRDFFTQFDPHAPPVTNDGTAVDRAVTRVVLGETSFLEEPLTDMRDDSSNVFVIATRIDIGTNKPALMRSFPTRRLAGPELDVNISLRHAMLATAVAPRYLRGRDAHGWRRPVIEPGLVDHGTHKNNPVRDLVFESRKMYRYANDMMVIVSIGTGVGFDPARETPELGKSVNDRNAEAAAVGDKFEAEFKGLMKRGWMKYFRFNVPDLQDTPLEEWCHEERIKEKTRTYLEQPDVGQSFYACVDAITAVLMKGAHAPAPSPPVGNGTTS